MNVDFFLSPKVPLSNANPGQPWRILSQQGCDGTDSRDGCLCPPSVATARKGTMPISQLMAVLLIRGLSTPRASFLSRVRRKQCV